MYPQGVKYKMCVIVKNPNIMLTTFAYAELAVQTEYAIDRIYITYNFPNVWYVSRIMWARPKKWPPAA